MKLETFFEKFELFADAPNAVAKMRELVLQLAVTGKLVEQREREGSASDLMQEIRAERAALVAARKIKARKSAPVLIDEQPFDIPAAWRWARLSDVGYELGQKVPDRRFTYIDVGSIDSDKGRVSERVETLEPNEAPSRARKQVAKGTVIYSTVRPYLLNIAIVEHDFEHEPIASTAFGILHPFLGINNRFLFHWLRSAPFTAYVQDGMKGMAYPAINDEKFYSGYIPVPPSAEQRRIVAKMDELMALCDRLEAQQQERDTCHAALARASLSRFAEAPTPANLDCLFHKSYPITPADLRKTILTLAVQGKLVPQDPNDELATELIARVATEKRRLVQTKEIKPEAPLDPISDEEVFPIPDSWTWLRAGDLCRPISSGSTPDQSVFHASEGIPYLKVYNIRNQTVDFDHKRQFIAVSHHEEKMKRSRLLPGDVIMNIVGPPLGKVAIVPDSFSEWNCNQAISFFRPIFSEFSPYLYTFLKEGSFLQNIQLIGTAGQDNISVTKCKYIPVPVPPLAEQRRIVAKVDLLMALVDWLETQLSEAKAKSTTLLDAVIHELLNPTVEIIDLASYRAAVGCYAISKMQGKRYFGRTAAMKVLYLAQAHVGLELGLKPMREAAGPFDSWLYRFEEQGEREAWFKVVDSTTAGGKKKIEYRPGRALAEQSAQAERAFTADQRKEFDRLLALFSDRTTEEAEIIATLFAAWNDFLIDGHEPSDDEIVREVRENWHEKKGRFTPVLLRKWLGWLRQNGLIPRGRLPRTTHQTQLLLN